MDGFGLDIFEITKNYGKCIPCNIFINQKEREKKKKKIVNLVLKIILDTRCDSCNDWFDLVDDGSRVKEKNEKNPNDESGKGNNDGKMNKAKTIIIIVVVVVVVVVVVDLVLFMKIFYLFFEWNEKSLEKSLNEWNIENNE